MPHTFSVANMRIYILILLLQCNSTIAQIYIYIEEPFEKGKGVIFRPESDRTRK